MSDSVARRHGLEPFLASAPAAGDPGVSISVRHDTGFLNLRGRPGDAGFREAAEGVLGLTLPLEPNTFAAGSFRICWLGPDEWLVAGPATTMPDLARSFEQALAGMPAAVNDVSGGTIALTLGGPHVRDVLARGCTLDLHPAVFREGNCAQTGLARASVLIACIDDAGAFEIVVRRSFADYLCRWLAHVGRNHGVSFAA